MVCAHCFLARTLPNLSMMICATVSGGETVRVLAGMNLESHLCVCASDSATGVAARAWRRFSGSVGMESTRCCCAIRRMTWSMRRACTRRRCIYLRRASSSTIDLTLRIGSGGVKTSRRSMLSARNWQSSRGGTGTTLRSARWAIVFIRISYCC